MKWNIPLHRLVPYQLFPLNYFRLVYPSLYFLRRYSPLNLILVLFDHFVHHWKSWNEIRKLKRILRDMIFDLLLLIMKSIVWKYLLTLTVFNAISCSTNGFPVKYVLILLKYRYICVLGSFALIGVSSELELSDPEWLSSLARFGFIGKVKDGDNLGSRFIQLLGQGRQRIVKHLQ